MKELMNELKDLTQLEEIKQNEGISVAVFSADWCPGLPLYRAVHVGTDQEISSVCILVY